MISFNRQRRRVSVACFLYEQEKNLCIATNTEKQEETGEFSLNMLQKSFLCFIRYFYSSKFSDFQKFHYLSIAVAKIWQGGG